MIWHRRPDVHWHSYVYVHLGEKDLLPALLHICQVSIQAIGQVRYGLARSSPLTTIDRYLSPLWQARQLVAAMDEYLNLICNVHLRRLCDCAERHRPSRQRWPSSWTALLAVRRQAQHLLWLQAFKTWACPTVTESGYSLKQRNEGE